MTMSSRVHKSARQLAALFGVLALSSSVLAGTGAQFIPLGFLDPDQFGPMIAYGMSADGSVVVGQGVAPGGFRAFRWTERTGLVDLGAFDNPGGFQSSGARACSADGSVVVGSSLLPNSLNEDGSPFRWTQATGLEFLGNLGGNDGGVARGVSTDGSVIVGYSSNASSGLEAFRWTSSGMPQMIGLGDLPGGAFNSQASSVSGDGSIVIGLASTSPSPYDKSFKWSQATGIQQLNPASFRAVGMSRDGVFGAGGNNGRAARVEIATGNLLMIPHVSIPGLFTDTDLAWAANADGSVIAGMQNLSQGNGFFGRAFIWDAQHGTRIVRDVLVNDFGLGAELAGWELNAATCVSDDGMVVAGYGFAPSGEQAAWVARLDVDLPGTPFCSVDVTSTACPCAQSGAAGHGCANSQNASGAKLTTSGRLSPDTLVLTSSGELPTSLSIFLQGDAASASGIVFGDGVRCAAGHLLRLASKNAAGGTVQYPGPSDPSITARLAALGFPIPSGATRYYQTYYRDPSTTFCPAPPGDTFNISNGVAITWP
jgi:probable HAF family extracellular repeat protein